MDFLERFKYAWQIAYQLWNTHRFAFFDFPSKKKTKNIYPKYQSEGRNGRENKENVYELIFYVLFLDISRFCKHKLTFKFMVSWSPTFSYSPAVQVPTASRNTIIKSQLNEPKSNGWTSSHRPHYITYFPLVFFCQQTNQLLSLDLQLAHEWQSLASWKWKWEIPKRFSAARFGPFYRLNTERSSESSGETWSINGIMTRGIKAAPSWPLAGTNVLWTGGCPGCCYCCYCWWVANNSGRSGGLVVTGWRFKLPWRKMHTWVGMWGWDPKSCYLTERQE